MERKLKPVLVGEELRGKGLRLFSPEEFRRLFGVTRRAAHKPIEIVAPPEVS